MTCVPTASTTPPFGGAIRGSLIADTLNARVVEVLHTSAIGSACGTVVWELTTLVYPPCGPSSQPSQPLGQPVSAERISNGSYLIATYNRVLEVRKLGFNTGLVVWDVQAVFAGPGVVPLTEITRAHEVPGHEGDGCNPNIVIVSLTPADIFEVIHPIGYDPAQTTGCWVADGFASWQYGGILAQDAHILAGPAVGGTITDSTVLVATTPGPNLIGQCLADPLHLVFEANLPPGYNPSGPTSTGIGPYWWAFGRYVNCNWSGALTTYNASFPATAVLNLPRGVWREGRRPATLTSPVNPPTTLIADTENHVALAVKHPTLPLPNEGGDIVWFQGNSLGMFGVSGVLYPELHSPAYASIPPLASLTAPGRRVTLVERGMVSGACSLGGHKAGEVFSSSANAGIAWPWFYGWQGNSGAASCGSTSNCDLWQPLDAREQ